MSKKTKAWRPEAAVRKPRCDLWPLSPRSQWGVQLQHSSWIIMFGSAQADREQTGNASNAAACSSCSMELSSSSSVEYHGCVLISEVHLMSRCLICIIIIISWCHTMLLVVTSMMRLNIHELDREIKDYLCVLCFWTSEVKIILMLCSKLFINQ